ncbi:MAG: hypothetical protein M1484_04935 [Patescibacteria group bacterium]|nr:hypothetical protein [Patescibacteria group bacterium]
MKKIELIWREILEEGIKNSVFEQKGLAGKFHLSTSTVFAAVAPLREIGAVAVTGRDFRLVNLEKVLTFWATHRHLNKDIIYQTRVNMPALEIEGLVDNQTVFAAYSATRRLLGSAPTDYDKVYVYAADAQNLRSRFAPAGGPANFFVLKSDPFLEKYGKTTCPSQTFVDLWNLTDWYAKDFLDGLKEKFYGFL